MTEESEAVRVARGAKLMDKILPGWYKRVDLKKLNMASASMCLLGQTFGVHNEASLAREMYPEEFEEATSDRDNKSHGYSIATDYTRRGIGVYTNMLTEIGEKLGLLPPVEPLNSVLLTNTNKVIQTMMNPDFATLTQVCRGHDNRCEWSAEVAARLAADEVTHDDK